MIYVYTDGACKVNPGKGGWGVVIVRDGVDEEFCGGCYQLTTNNRMEMLAVIKGLQKLEAIGKRKKVIVYSDSRYVVDSMRKGWALRWKAKGWVKAGRKKAKNIDLWKQLLDLADHHLLSFQWVKGHDGNPYNERCDFLCNQGIEELPLVKDEGYESEESVSPQQMTLF